MSNTASSHLCDIGDRQAALEEKAFALCNRFPPLRWDPTRVDVNRCQPIFAGLPDEFDESEFSIFYLATRFSDLELVTYLVDSYLGDWTLRSGYVSSPLGIAELQYRTRPAIADYLLNLDREPIHIAAARGNLSQIDRLLSEPGSSVNSFTRAGRTPLHYAVQNNSMAAVKHLIERHHADPTLVDGELNSLIHVAARYASSI